MTKKHKIIISAVTVIIILVIYIIFDRKSKNQVSDNIETQTATTTFSNGQINIQGKGGYKIEQVPIDEGRVAPKPIPDLDRIALNTSGAIINPESITLATEKIKTLQIRLKNNPSDLVSWLDLGMYQKMMGDYEGAVISWKYASRLSPTDYISPANLGNLYAYFLKDNGLAEVYYKEAISKGPTQSNLYTQLAEVYRDVFNDLDKARVIVKEGLTKIPNDPNLLQLQASLK